jgi:hypothetical protein
MSLGDRENYVSNLWLLAYGSCTCFLYISFIRSFLLIQDIVNMATNGGNSRQRVPLGDITNTNGQG